MTGHAGRARPRGGPGGAVRAGPAGRAGGGGRPGRSGPEAGAGARGWVPIRVGCQEAVGTASESESVWMRSGAPGRA